MSLSAMIERCRIENGRKEMKRTRGHLRVLYICPGTIRTCADHLYSNITTMRDLKVKVSITLLKIKTSAADRTLEPWLWLEEHS